MNRIETVSEADNYDVSIVGYGPTGMMLAALLGRQNHRVLVLDRHTGLYNLPRAACFDDEIMRTFQKLSLVDQVMPGTVVQTGYDWVNADGETLLEMTYDNPARNGWAALYMMYQPHIETVLDRLCRSLPNVHVRQGACVEGLDVGDEDVTLTATDREGRRSAYRSRFAVGADGGGGFVRPALGIGYSDYGFEENWLVCDFRKRRELPGVPSFRQICDPAQPVSIVRIGTDHQRFSFMLDPDEPAAQATDTRRVWERVARFLTPEDADLIRVANYMFRSRVSDQWRQGPVLLAGDAAHEMPPFLAQGMCSGMRDSHNLAWKLDLILNARADAKILDTYQPEREPHVRFITEKAIELGRVQTLRDPVAARARDRRMLALKASQRVPERLAFPPIESGLLCHGSPLAGELFPQRQVRDGDGVPRLFDDAVGVGPTILVRRSEILESLCPAALELWASIGGTVVTISASDKADDPRVGIEVGDADGFYCAWFDAHVREAAVIRPDWYLYGTAADGPELAALVADLHRQLGGERPAVAPAPA
jgi:2-polyprenyl-6-methoxyphenol hydroxylase-like FAD-dependent oxidoreductase